VSFLSDRQLERLDRLITAECERETHRRIEVVLSWHLNERGLAWPSLNRIKLVLERMWPPDPDAPKRGHTAPGTSWATIKRVLASSSVYTTVGQLATQRQRGGGWFVHGSLRALTDNARERIGLHVSLAETLQWAAAAGVVAPLGELAPQRFRRALNEP
jgi:hypothetical protein